MTKFLPTSVGCCASKFDGGTSLGLALDVPERSVLRVMNLPASLPTIHFRSRAERC